MRIPRPASLLVLFLAAGLQARPPLKSLPFAVGPLTADGKPAAAGQAFRWGQTLATGGASADVCLPGIAALRLRPGTLLKLLRDRRGAVRIVLERGGILSVVKKGSKYSVQTPLAVAAVRGTVFFVQSEPAGKVYSCLCEGHYTLTSGAKVRDIKARHHQALEVSPQGDAAAGLLYHTDEDISALKVILKGT